jgi:hypothetical protein
MLVRGFVKVKNSIVMFHHYPDAPNEVAFLKHPHRHNFIVHTKVQVNPEADRDIEFFMLQTEIDDYLATFKLKFNEKSFSCEEIAKFVLRHVRENITKDERYISVEVSEDGENSAVVEEYAFIKMKEAKAKELKETTPQPLVTTDMAADQLATELGVYDEDNSHIEIEVDHGQEGQEDEEEEDDEEVKER